MSSLLLISCLFSRFCTNSNTPNQYQTLNDIFNTAKQLWSQQNYTEAYRLFYELGEVHHYQSSLCAWYQIQCLTQSGQWRQAIQSCQVQINRQPHANEWYVLASEIYMERYDYIMAWEILNQVPLLCPDIETKKRIAYEATHRNHPLQIIRTDILNKLPHEVAAIIFGFLDFKSLVKCTRVSKQWRHLLMHNPILWNALEFSTVDLDIKTINFYLNQTQVSKLSISRQANGDDIFQSLVKTNCVSKLHTLVLSDIICTPPVFSDTLKSIGSTLSRFQWGGICVRLNDIFDTLSKHCPHLTQLTIHDCFTSMFDIRMPNGTSYRLEDFGESFPSEFISSTLSLPTLPHLTSLELTSIHGLTASHLAHILIRCPNLIRLKLHRCLVNIIPVLNILKSFCPHIKYLTYEKNQCCMPSPYFQQLQPKQYPSYNHPWIELKIQSTDTLTDHVLQDLLVSTIEHLDLSGSGLITDAGILHKPLKNLKSLSLRGCTGITREGVLDLLKQNTRLEHVDLPVLNDAILDQLSTCQNLKTLVSARVDVSNERYKAFIDARKCTLRKVRLDQSSISTELLCYTMQHVKTGYI